MILITGASGAIGYELALLLSGRDDVRLLAHSERSARRLAPLGREVVRGDLAEPEDAERAFEGVERLFLLTPFALDQDRLEANALALARRAGVEHVVKISVEFANDPEPIAVAAPHHASERRLAASGLPACVLRPTSYASNLLHDVEQLRQGVLTYPAGDAHLAHIDPRDVAEAAATALLADEPIVGAFELRGPQPLTYGEVAELIGVSTPRPRSGSPPRSRPAHRRSTPRRSQSSTGATARAPATRTRPTSSASRVAGRGRWRRSSRSACGQRCGRRPPPEARAT